MNRCNILKRRVFSHRYFKPVHREHTQFCMESIDMIEYLWEKCKALYSNIIKEIPYIRWKYNALWGGLIQLIAYGAHTVAEYESKEMNSIF